MKCKITRQDKKLRLKSYQTFLKELENLNPKLLFSMEASVIQVEDEELWKLNLPEGSEVFIGKDKEDFQIWGYLAVRYRNIVIYIYSW